MSRILAIALTLLAAASAAQADVYRWTDSNGTVQYSDRWRPGSVLVKTDKSRPSTPPPAPAAAGTEPATTGTARANEILSAQQDQRTVQQDVAKVKAEQCKKARDDYDKAIQSRRLFKEGTNGSREYVSDAEADAYRAKLLGLRKELCGS